MHIRFSQFVLLLFACAAIVFAQPTGGTLSGTITSPSGAAVANAVYNATGVRITDLPLTPEKVLRGLHTLRAARSAGQ